MLVKNVVFTLYLKFLSENKMAVYFQTWSAPWVDSGAKMELSLLDPRIEMVYLAFADPKGTYTKGTFQGTGLQFSMDFDVVKQAIAILKSRGVTVMLSVGGGTYPFGHEMPCHMINLATDLGCDGIDIDAENTPWGPVVELYRKHAPLMKISAAVWSTGAYATTMTQDLQKYIELADWLNLMAYDAGNDYVPLDAYRAYKALYSKKIYVGFCIGTQSWGGHVTDLNEVIKVKNGLDKGDSFFIWAMGKQGSPSISEILGATIPKENPVPTQPILGTPCPNCGKILTLQLYSK